MNDIEKAIKQFKRWEESGWSKSEVPNTYMLILAKKALEKQIPKKPKKQDIKIIIANGEGKDEIEKRLNDLTEQGYKSQSSNVEWYNGGILGAFCMVKDLEEVEDED